MAKSEGSDYILPIYKDRALKHLVKLAGGKVAIKHLDADQLRKMKSARDVIAKDMQFNTLKWFRPFKYQTEFFETGANFARRGMIAANRAGKCCTAATVLDLPDGSKITYGEMYRQNKPFKVWSWDGEKAVIKTAIQPIMKPAEPCVRLWMSNGRWIETALGHRVLQSGAEYVFCESLLPSLPHLGRTSLECGRLTHASDEERSWKTLLGSLIDCLENLRSCDELLLFAINTGLNVLPSQVDALRQSFSWCSKDDLVDRYTNIHQPRFDHLSIQDACLQILGLFAEYLDGNDNMPSAKLSDYIQELQRLVLASIAELQSVHVTGQDQIEKPSLANPFSVDANQIIAYQPIGVHDCYDFTVPGTENYISAGIVHHNTIASTYETAYHLTGRYPKNWKGKKWDKPIIAMCSGESWEQVAKTLQSKLLGCDDIKQSYKLGTGSIPLECIDQKSYRTDGANVLSIEIWHESGGKSKLYFSNYTQQVRHLQGFELDLVVLDEQPPDEIFSELVVRTAQRNGQVMCSFTPLKGMSGLVRKFWDKIDGYTHVRVTWDDIPYENEWGEKFFSQEERDQLSRDFMPWERECRMKGIPLVGKGVVFPILNWPTYKSTEIDLKNDPKMERLISFDLGIRNDPTVISFFFRNPIEEIIYLHRQIKIPQGETPDEYVHYLLDRESKGAPIALPHDAAQAGRYTLTEQSVREVFEDNYGLNCIPGAILNPMNDQGKVTNHKSYGINIMRMGMERSTLMINESCVDFLDEARNYAIDDAGKFSDPDDHIDSARIGILALIQGHGESMVSRANTFQYRRPSQVDGKVQRI